MFWEVRSALWTRFEILIPIHDREKQERTKEWEYMIVSIKNVPYIVSDR